MGRHYTRVWVPEENHSGSTWSYCNVKEAKQEAVRIIQWEHDEGIRMKIERKWDVYEIFRRHNYLIIVNLIKLKHQRLKEDFKVFQHGKFCYQLIE